MRPEVHETFIRDGVATMRPAAQVTIPPGGLVRLQPGGLHIMLMELNYPLEEGAMLPLTLEFGADGRLTVDIPVLSIRAKGPDG
ncbi:MAG: copper chaperone PCu(A)C [Nitratireductor sp.]